jgi:ATP-binding cassette subfamily F protein uup
MALIDLTDIYKRYEAQKVLEGVNFTLECGERVCLIGRNGSGKSTLLKIMIGKEDADEGTRIIQSGIKIEALAQEPIFQAGLSVKEAIEAEFEHLTKAKARLQEIAVLLAKDFDDKALLDEHDKLGAMLENADAWNLENKVERIIGELKLKELANTKVESLSGGERRRVSLAGLLIKKPDILLLDEPTNHLDVGMVAFLENLLLEGKYTIIFISHDRYFIDALSTRTVEIDGGKTRSFKGGYADYLTQKQALLEAMQTEHDNLLRHLKLEEKWLAQGISARRKRNEGRKARLMDLRVKSKTNPAAIRKVRLELEREKKAFNGGGSSNKQKELFKLDKISVVLGGRCLIDSFSTRILQKDRLAIVGPNGAGKSTFVKLLLGQIKQTSGVIKQGDFKVGYFDQSREMLSDDKNLIETFCPHGGDRVDVQGKNMHVYGYLKNFLFPREFLDKKIGILSGGEKNRVALAWIFAQKTDCLILDEPTNDLDIPTINILEEYIQSYSGAVIIVSHDRYFVDKIAKKLFIMPGNGHIEESWQSFSEWIEDSLELKELEAMEQASEKAPKSERPKQISKKLSYKELRELESLPLEIQTLEVKINEYETLLNDPSKYAEISFDKISKELDLLRLKCEEKTMQYFELLDKCEALNT